MITKQRLIPALLNRLSKLTYCRKANATRDHWFIYKYFLSRHLSWKDCSYSCSIPQNVFASKVKINKTIWIYWAQGLDEAPTIVKRCVESVRKNMPHYDIVILTLETWNNFVSMPEYILNKYSKGIIGQAHFSDLLRVHLLATYGGVWCDATCYMTQPIPDIILDSPFFMFQRTMLSEHISPIKGSNWFLVSKKGNIVAEKVRNFMFSYWNHYNEPLHYYIFHLSLGLIFDKDADCKRHLDNMPYICNAQPHILQFALSNKYSVEKWNFIVNSCFIHKLTYKYNKQLEANSEDNILKHILQYEKF